MTSSTRGTVLDSSRVNCSCQSAACWPHTVLILACRQYAARSISLQHNVLYDHCTLYWLTVKPLSNRISVSGAISSEEHANRLPRILACIAERVLCTNSRLWAIGAESLGKMILIVSHLTHSLSCSYTEQSERQTTEPRRATPSQRMPPTLYDNYSGYDFDLWPLTLKTFPTIPSHMMNICGKFHWNPSNTRRDTASRKIGVL